MLLRINAFAHAFAILFLAAILAGSSSPATARLLPLSPQQVARLGIRTVPVRPAVTKSVLSVLGRVTPAPDARIPVAAPFAGTLKSLIRLEGETVKKGDALAVIASADMQASLARLQSQEARYRAARAAATRARALVDEGIAPSARGEEAAAEAAAAAAELAALRGATARAVRSGDGEYRLLAPANGRIAAINIGMGETVASMQPVLSIDSGTEIWIEAALPASMIGKVASGDGVSVDGHDATGTVVAVGSSIDSRTRAATLRARLNPSARLIPGQTVRLSVTAKADARSFNVPRNAVSEIKGASFVFLVRKGGFEAVPVRVLARGARDATIMGQLSARDLVAVTGVSELKAIRGQE